MTIGKQKIGNACFFSTHSLLSTVSFNWIVCLERIVTYWNVSVHVKYYTPSTNLLAALWKSQYDNTKPSWAAPNNRTPPQQWIYRTPTMFVIHPLHSDGWWKLINDRTLMKIFFIIFSFPFQYHFYYEDSISSSSLPARMYPRIIHPLVLFFRTNGSSSQSLRCKHYTFQGIFWSSFESVGMILLIRNI